MIDCFSRQNHMSEFLNFGVVLSTELQHYCSVFALHGQRVGVNLT